MAIQQTHSAPAEKQVHSATEDFDLFQLPKTYYDNPYPFFKHLRDNEPAHVNSDGSVLLTRYDDVKAVWRALSGVVNRKIRRRSAAGTAHHQHALSRSAGSRPPP